MEKDTDLPLPAIRDNVMQKYHDAELLTRHGRYANAIYLCGYCIELSLKYCIAAHLNWPAYQTGGKLKFLKSHDLDLLVALTGREMDIKKRSSWAIANTWNETRRYEDPSLACKEDALGMLAAAKEFVEELCEVSI